MNSRTASVLTIAGISICGLIAYAAYFDYKRRTDPAFRKKIRKEKKRIDKSLAQSREALASANEVSDAELREALKQIKSEPVPPTQEARQNYFMSQVAMGEQLAARGEPFHMPSALSFYRALVVYPSPPELLSIYQKTVPEPIVKIIMRLASLEGTPDSPPPEAVNPWLLPPAHVSLAWPLGQQLDMHVHLSTSPNGDVFSSKWTSGYRKDQDEGLPSFFWKNLTFGDYNDARVVEYNINFPPSVLKNGSLWADIFLTKNGASPDPQNAAFNPADIHHVRKLLTPHIPKLKVRREKNLLSSNTTDEPEEVEADVITAHWHSNLTLALVSDAAVIPFANLPPPVREHVTIIPNERDETGTKGFYKPIVFPNEFWHLRSHYIELNATTPTLPLQIVFQPMSFMKFQIFASMTHGFKEAAKSQGSGAGAELDEVKRMLLETNPWFLGLTGLVSILHVLFEMLAFKSDVSHWRHKKEMVGVSVRTIITNVFVQFIILLYLIDNNENTSWMILFGSGTGVLIEAWKITKAVDISLIPAPAGSLLPYKIEVKDKHVLSEDEKKTQEYDKLAFRYVSYVAIPTLAAYTVYSLMYESHKGWYSFVISTLTSFVYMFGFAQLVPQLIINYKLKSVAHMPMKAMIYKTLSTVVDDFFAFCIKMPFLHRLACFRDDVVFLIFLYQRWIYRIDPKRVNEYGQVLAGDVDAAGETKKTRQRTGGVYSYSKVACHLFGFV